jgi:hypothetical protein
MIRHRATREVLEDLRFALEVMEESEHSGLDDHAADVLRSRILGQIERIKAHIACEPVLDSSLLAVEYE